MLITNLLPLLQTAGTWTVQVGPWALPPQAWVPATALIGGFALRVRARQIRGPGAPHAAGRSED